ncbi:uncharacterized protein LOC115890497 isoform X2 [Sitophilus oryzae]|uniref:Uncharacterized protein LOC115890497 isoform X2 n=1 Tax=Sitophilus oryzae TaxID=7048 RepID=A0A6J2YUU1_SITOR|nr:uncharacterized protein LOC115890497 isoform X2 [Sitophilus oryzae]
MSEDSSTGSDSDTGNEDNRTAMALFTAIYKNDCDEIRKLVSKNRSVVNFNMNGTTPLHAVLKQAIKAKGSKKPLMEAIKELLKNGANQEAKNEKDESAVDVVTKRLKKYPDDSDWKSINSLFDRSKEKTQLSSKTVQADDKRSVNRMLTLVQTQSDAPTTSKTRPPGETYAVSGLKTSLHGTIYQLQLLMSLLNRGLNKYDHFDLATEMNKAEKFDDAVIRYKTSQNEQWSWRFFQAKHKQDVQRDRITVNDLLTESDGPFSIQKYFVSFCKIKSSVMFDQSNLEEFDLCTNTDFDFSEIKKRKNDGNLTPAAQQKNDLVNLWKNLLELENLESDVFLSFPNITNAKKYKFSDNAIPSLSKLLNSNFLKKSLELEKLKELKSVMETLQATQVIEDLKEILKEIEYNVLELEGSLNNNKSEKGKYISLANKLLNVKNKFMSSSRYDYLKKIIVKFKKIDVKDQNYFSERLKVFDVSKDLLKENLSFVSEAENKLFCFEDISSSEHQALKKDICTIIETKERYIDFSDEIVKSKDLSILKSNLYRFPYFQKNLDNFEKKGLGLDSVKEKLLDNLENDISDLVMLELILNNIKLEEFLKEFLRKFRFVVCYPDVDRLNLLIKKEMRNKYSFINTDLITDSFQKEMLDWFKDYKEGRSEYLSKDRGVEFFQHINLKIKSLMVSGLNKAYPEKLKGFNISFERSILTDFLSSENKFVHLSTKRTRLSAIKVLQGITESGLYKEHDSFIFIPLENLSRSETQKLVIDTFGAIGRHDLLVIECYPETYSNFPLPYWQEFIDNVHSILINNKEKKIILIGGQFDELATLFKSLNISGTEMLQDESSFKCLSHESQFKLLQQPVTFQGERMSINQLIGLECARKIINETHLDDLINGKIISLGDEKAFKFTDCAFDCYVPRSLHMQKLKKCVFGIKRSIFFLTCVSNSNIYPFIENLPTYEWVEGTIYSYGIIYTKQSDDPIRVFNKICTSHPELAVYWIHQIQNDFFWKVATKNVDQIQDCVELEYELSDDQLFTEENFVKDFSNKVMLLANGPGTGKSTFLASVGKRLKKKHNMWWIARINLNDYAFENELLHSDDLRKYTRSVNEIHENINTTEAIEVISEMVIPRSPLIFNNDFQREIFKEGLRNGNAEQITPKIVILFDGFDEISPHYKEKTAKLITEISKTNIQNIWITTRMNEKDFLERAFSTPAFMLSPFNEQQQINFLMNFWRHNFKNELGNISNQNIYLFEETIKKYVTTIQKNLLYNEEREDSLISIQCADDIFALFNFTHFAHQLVDQWKNSVKDTATAFTNNPLQLKMLAEIVFWENFELIGNLSLLELFNRFIDRKFAIFYEQKSILGVSTGSAEIREDHSQILLHKHDLIAFQEIFPDHTEYMENINIEREISKLTRVGLLVKNESRLIFVHRSFAEYFVSGYLTKNLNMTEVQNILFKYVFSYEDYLVVALFLDQRLGKETHGMILQEPAIAYINEAISKQFIEIFTHHLALNNLSNTLKFILRVLCEYPALLESVLLKDGIYGKFLLFELVYDPIGRYNFSESSNILNAILMTINDQDDLLLKLYTKKVLEGLVLLDSRQANITILQVTLLSSSNKNMFQLLLDFVRSKMYILRQILFQSGDELGTLLHFCCRYASRKLKFFLDCLNLSETCVGSPHFDLLSELILSKDALGSTALHLLAFRNRSEDIQLFLACIKNFSEKLLTELLLSRDKKSLTVLDIAVYRNYSETTVVLLDFLKHRKEFKAVVFQNGLENNILYRAICQGKDTSMLALLDWLHSACLDSGDLCLMDFLFEKHPVDGRTSLGIAAARNFGSTLFRLLEWLNGTNDDRCTNRFLLQLLASTSPDHDGKTALHQAVYWESEDALKVIVEYIIENFDIEALATLLLATDKFYDTPMDLAKNEQTKTILRQGYDMIISTLLSVSENLNASDTAFVLFLDHLNVLENFVNRHVEHRQREALDAIVKLKRMSTTLKKYKRRPAELKF